MVERDDLAQELASQVRDKGRDLDVVAQEHGLPVIDRLVFRKELGEALSAALATAKDSEVVGPIATPQGFALVQIKDRQESVLNPAIRQAIEQEQFEKWLADGTKEATFDFAVVGTAGGCDGTATGSGRLTDDRGLFVLRRQPTRPLARSSYLSLLVFPCPLPRSALVGLSRRDDQPNTNDPGKEDLHDHYYQKRLPAEGPPLKLSFQVAVLANRVQR